MSLFIFNKYRKSTSQLTDAQIKLIDPEYTHVGSVNQTTFSGGEARTLSFDDEGNYVYCVGSNPVANPYISVVDVSDETTPTIITTYAISVHSVNSSSATHGNYFYFSNHLGDISVVNISTRTSPSYVGNAATHSGTDTYKGLYAPGDGYLYASYRRTGGNNARLRIFDIAGNPTSPTLTGDLDLGTTTRHTELGIRVVNNSCFLSCTDSTTHQWVLVDVTTKSSPSIVYTRTGGGILHGYAAHNGTTAFVQTGAGGFVTAAVDLTTTSLPTLGSVSNGPQGRGNFWDSGFVIHPGHGIYDVRIPSSPTIAVSGVSGSYNQDWAMDYHYGRRLTATSYQANSGRLDIGQVSGI